MPLRAASSRKSHGEIAPPGDGHARAFLTSNPPFQDVSAFSEDNFDVKEWINWTFKSAEAQKNKDVSFPPDCVDPRRLSLFETELRAH